MPDFLDVQQLGATHIQLYYIIHRQYKVSIPKSGSFVISLDFELMWGVRDKKSIETYGNSILGVRSAIPAMLNSFERHQIKATFATVGFLFAKDKTELVSNIPISKPRYILENLSPYEGYIDSIGRSEEDDKYHYAYSLIELIASYGHEVSTHTFSHYYCLEDGQELENFDQDLKNAIKIAGERGIKIESIVFPRNQFNKDYLKLCTKYGISSFRGNPNSWIYSPSKNKDEGLLKRAMRLMDSYFNLSGYAVHDYELIVKSFPHNIAASAFLRPFNKRLKVLEPLRLKRIKNAMTHAAVHNKVYHLWWHPHNFGNNLEENMAILNDVLKHFSELKSRYNFTSLTMSELSRKLSEK